jgi:hypothetical protein
LFEKGFVEFRQTISSQAHTIACLNNLKVRYEQRGTENEMEKLDAGTIAGGALRNGAQRLGHL